VARQIRTAVVIVTLLVPLGWFVTNAGGTPGTSGLSTLRPGTLATAATAACQRALAGPIDYFLITQGPV
jgi:hypothetical protein